MASLEYFSRRSFIVASGLGVLILAGCSGSKGDDSKSGSASKAKNVKSNGQPFQLIDFKYRLKDNSYTVSYSVRNNLTDKAIIYAPLLIKALDTNGKEIEEFGYQKEFRTKYIDPGEVMFFEDDLDVEDATKVSKLVLEPNYSKEKSNYYYTDNPLPKGLFTIEQDGEPVFTDNSVQVRVNLTPTDVYRSNDRFRNVDRVDITAVFYDDKGEMVQVLNDTSPVNDPHARIPGFLQFFDKFEFSKIEFTAIPDIDLMNSTRVYFE